MQRRNFMQQSLVTGATILTGATLRANATAENAIGPNDAKPFNLQYGIHDGMFKELAGNDFLDQLKFAYDNGFRDGRQWHDAKR